jgi:hypothetical protein
VTLLATGSTPIPGEPLPPDAPPSYGPYDVPAAGGHVLVRDEMGRLAAMLTAERLSHGWKKVTLVTSALHPGEGEGITTAYSLIRALGRRGIAIVDRAKVAGFTGRTAALSGVFGERREAVHDVDAVVSLLGATSRIPLLAPLRDAGLDVRVIGDARLPRSVTEAVRDAAVTVWSLGVGNEAESPVPVSAA